MINCPMAKVGDLADQIRGVSYTGSDAIHEPRDGYVPILRANNITDEGLTFDDLVYVPKDCVNLSQFVRQNDVVIAASSGSLDVVGKAAQAKADLQGGFGAFCKVLRPSSRIHPNYFFHFFQTPAYRRTISALVGGANINNLRNEHLDNLLIPLPDIAEQRHIAEVLDKAEILRANRRQALSKLDSLTQSFFSELFASCLSSDHRTNLSELVEGFRYGTSNKSDATGYPALRIPNVVSGSLNLEEVKLVPVERAEFERLQLRDGDLLFVRTNGNPDFVGRCAVFQRESVQLRGFDAANFIYASYLIRARVQTDKILPLFLQEFLATSQGRRALRSRCKTSAGQ
jgi:type I restriction enzyme S subunit